MSKKFVYTVLSVVLSFSLQGNASEKCFDREVSPVGVNDLGQEFSNEDLLLDAVKNGNEERALFLINEGANISYFNSPSGWNDLMAHALSNSNFDLALKLTEKGVSIQCVNTDGATYAHAMAYDGNIESLSFLGRLGLDLDSNGVLYCDDFTCRGMKLERPIDIAYMVDGHRSDTYKFLYERLSPQGQKRIKAKKKKLASRFIR